MCVRVAFCAINKPYEAITFGGVAIRCIYYLEYDFIFLVIVNHL
jgi:hypothetical protein